ncbi:MAG: ABC transporter ATP-binding protein [Candidatus Omnitrophica bacterium]|nr:ABC transporter ATP-binding protein [Candidatus Omnitrophota bacterium]
MDKLLEIKNLKVYFYSNGGITKVIDEVSLDIKRGEFFAVVGESGCGKTMLALSILNLVPSPGRIVEGNIVFEGKELINFSERDWQSLRGKDIAMVFQEPLTSLNPVLSVGTQIVEMLVFHLKMDKREARLRAIDSLRNVGFDQPEVLLDSYPHQLSGGMRQRAMIAMSLCCNPKLLILDEPTTALDTTIQAQILELIFRIKREFQLTSLFITHDLAIVEEIADRVGIMYLGKIVETGKVEEIFQNPKHPYTQKLLACFPELSKPKTFLNAIPGQVPDILNRPLGCPFHPRCEKRVGICDKEFPETSEITESHWVWCHNF